MKVEKESVEREVVTTVTETVVHLTLTETEAAMLASLLGKISGWVKSPDNPRLASDRIWDALDSAGYGETNEQYKRSFALVRPRSLVISRD